MEIDCFHQFWTKKAPVSPPKLKENNSSMYKNGTLEMTSTQHAKNKNCLSRFKCTIFLHITAVIFEF